MEGLNRLMADLAGLLRRLLGGAPARRPPGVPTPTPTPPTPETPPTPMPDVPAGDSPGDRAPAEEAPDGDQPPASEPDSPPAEAPLPPIPFPMPDAEPPEPEPPAPPPVPLDTGEAGDASPSAPPPVEPAPEVAAAPCRATVLPELGVVNIRGGPGLTFDKVGRASGGQEFGVGGVSGLDPDGFAWYWIDWDGGSGWIRNDLLALSGDCAALEPIEPLPPEPPAPPPPSHPEGRFPLPVPDVLTQGFHNAHKGYDLGAPLGRELQAFTEGVVIRRMDCTACTPEKPNVLPSSLTQAERDALFANPAWGFGYGNFITVRYAYGLLPQALRQEMDALDLTDGFAYVLFAHMSRVDVRVGDRVQTGTLLGLTGNTGHSSAPHLHLEVKVGRAQTVDGVWLKLAAVHPNLLFMDNA